MTAMTVRVSDLVDADAETTRAALARLTPASARRTTASRVYIAGTGAGTVVTLETRLDRGGMYRRSRALHQLERDLTALREELESAQAIYRRPGTDVIQEESTC